MNLSVLNRLLPGWEFRKEDFGPRLLMLPPGANVWQCIGREHGGTATAMYNDHLEAEIERALLAREGYRSLSMFHSVETDDDDKEIARFWGANAVIGGKPYSEYAQDTKLLALIAVAEKVLGGTE